MKDATGELSVTVIAIVAIAAILAVFTVFLLPTLKAQIALTQACNSGPTFKSENDSGKIECKGKAEAANKTGQTWECVYTDKDTNKTSSKQCHN